MAKECYEDLIMNCAELLEKARTVDSEENRKAVHMMSRELAFDGLEIDRKSVV